MCAGGTSRSSNSGVRCSMTVAYTGDSITGSFYGSDSVQTSGDYFGASANTNRVYVPNFDPVDLVVSIAASVITFDSTSLADFGWVDGNSGTWSWGSGASADSVTLVAAVPEPRAYAALFGLVALGLVAVRRRL